MNAMFKASDKKFWQSDEDGDDEAVIELLYTRCLGERKHINTEIRYYR